MLDVISSAVSTTCKIVVLKVIKNLTPCSSLVAANVNEYVFTNIFVHFVYHSEGLIPVP